MFYKNRISIQALVSYQLNSDIGQCSIQIEPGYRVFFYTNATRIQVLVLYKWNHDTGPYSIQIVPRIQGLLLY
jgi:hypothetical protein